MSNRFLVSDDDEDIRDFIAYVLERAGHDVATAGNGAEALARATEDEFDLILLDHHMPRMTGLEVAVQLRALRPSARVLLMSGDLDVGRQHPHFLPKPFNRTELAAAVAELIGS
ncbi:CheY-like chemotaxis protein [Nocardioides cavernae]|uniref:CheY-like chemotaxis protein n=1 Tax=Nocardioides cavernae TaxID=1921566 RepID=A0A7Y9KRQ0_9ACTN|nr:response regulator [Nocardioides cavernae]NYE36805.1 CheY-like chemotaxis protein [Nocardioides cavernae]